MMNKRKCYLAGGMQKFGKDRFDESNFWRMHIQNSLAEMPVKIFNPNDYFSFKDEPPRYASQREVMDFDHNLVRNSDFIVVNFNDPDSKGTMSEITIANEHRIPVIGLVSKENEPLLHPWEVEMTSRFFYDIDELIQYVIDYYIY